MIKQLMTTVDKSVKLSSGNLNISVTHTKKSQSASVLVSFPGAPSVLLTKLMHLYVTEYTIPGFMHAKSFMFNAIVGPNSIMFECPDSKVLNAILAFYLNLHKMKITNVHLKNIDIKSDTFKKLYTTLENIDIHVVGKCKSTASTVATAGKKWDAFCSSLNDIHKKFEDKVKTDITSTKFVPIPTKMLVTNDKPKDTELFNLYLAIILGTCTCSISNAGSGTVTLKFYDNNNANWSTVYKASFQTMIKGFLQQFGTIGSEPSDKEGKKKYADKLDQLLKSLNAASEQICKLRGLRPYKFTSADDVKNINKDLIQLLKTMKET